MSTEIDLLRAIANDPDDPTVRAVYADWLIERSNPRGELLQLEAALAQMDDFDERRRATKARIEALLEAHAASWLAPFRPLEAAGIEFRIERGIVSTVIGSAKQLAAAAHVIVQKAPLVFGIEIEVGQVRDLEPLRDSPLLARARHLALRHFTPVRPTGWTALQTPELRSLELSAIAAGPEDLGAVLAAPNAPHLGSLSISNCRLNRNALEPLATVRAPIRKLDMPAHKQGPRLGELLGGNLAFHQLAQLRIPGNPIGSPGLVALEPALAHVENLDVRGCDLVLADFERLLAPGRLPDARELWIGGQTLGDGIIEILVRWGGLRQLRRLHLGSAGISDRGACALADLAALANLRSLVLSGPRFSPATEEVMRLSPHLAAARIYAGDRALARTPPKKRPARARAR